MYDIYTGLFQRVSIIIRHFGENLMKAVFMTNVACQKKP